MAPVQHDARKTCAFMSHPEKLPALGSYWIATSAFFLRQPAQTRHDPNTENRAGCEALSWFLRFLRITKYVLRWDSNDPLVIQL
jgi:hypothetical protein